MEKILILRLKMLVDFLTNLYTIEHTAYTDKWRLVLLNLKLVPCAVQQKTPTFGLDVPKIGVFCVF
ncbi:hypothetical protein [uncultured Microscilla sp.]|uniref:hypothetical protein n=1 Tax=uncultured Microscilla sp. TaxID=432653 RepID=UPI0026290ED4|nr:hypothetical protein [uncultured Microscilla sp.]